PFYFFVPKDETGKGTYEKGWAIVDIFGMSNVGIVTARDKFCTDVNLESLKKRMLEFKNPTFTDQYFIENYGLKNTSTFDLAKARKAVMNLSKDEFDNFFKKLAYRPFDERWIFYQ